MKNLINKPFRTAFERIKKFLISLKDLIIEKWSDLRTSSPFEKIFTAWVIICTFATALFGLTINLNIFGKIVAFCVFSIPGFLVGVISGLMLTVLIALLVVFFFLITVIPIVFNPKSRYTIVVSSFWEKALERI